MKKWTRPKTLFGFAFVLTLLLFALGLYKTQLLNHFISAKSKANNSATGTSGSEGNIRTALAAFYKDCGFYPTTQEGLRALRVTLSRCIDWGPKPYLAAIPKDSNGQDFNYVSDGETYQLKSGAKR